MVYFTTLGVYLMDDLIKPLKANVLRGRFNRLLMMRCGKNRKCSAALSIDLSPSTLFDYQVHAIFPGEERRPRFMEESLYNDPFPCGDDNK